MSGDMIVGLSLGFVGGMTVMALLLYLTIKNRKPIKLSKTAQRVGSFALVALLVGLLAFANAAGVRADTPTPYPTLTIPIDSIFTSTNNWMVTFAPIAAIGIGIALAIKILGYVGKSLGTAF